METEYGSYGDRDRDYLALQGWRLATQQEIDTAEAKISKDKISREMGLDRIEEQLRRARPELFKA